VQEAYAVLSARNRHRYPVVKIKHLILGDCGFNFSFDGLGKTFFAESLSRVRSKKESVSALAQAANSRGSIRAHQASTPLMF
jgi:hypothetical protein